MYKLNILKREPEKILKIFIGCVILAAALFRILNLDAGKAELVRIFLPEFILYPLIIPELALGLMLITSWNERYALIIGIFIHECSCVIFSCY